MSNLSLSNAPTVSVCLVGNSTVGKTSIVIKFRTSEFNEEYVPRQYTGSYVVYKYDGYSIKLLFYDTIGLDDFEHVNSQFEKVADIYLLCFALDDRKSFLDLVKYIRQLNSIKGLPLHEKVVFLVGTKSDSFECENSKSISGNDLKSIQRDVKRKISIKQNSTPVLTPSSENPTIPLPQGISSNSSLIQKKRIQQQQEEESVNTLKGGIKLPYPTLPNQTTTPTTTTRSPNFNLITRSTIATTNVTQQQENNGTDNDDTETNLIQQLKQESKSTKQHHHHTRQRSSSTGSLHNNETGQRPPHPTRTFDNKPRPSTAETLVSPRYDEQQRKFTTTTASDCKNELNNNQQMERTYAVSSEEISSFLSKYPIISGYIECSSKDGNNINQIFTEALKIYYKRMKIEKLGKEQENCLLM